MTWEIETRILFDNWFELQSDDVQEEILAHLGLLEEDGPSLGRPQVDQISGSKYSNMKKLRVQVRGIPSACSSPLTRHARRLFYAPVIRRAKLIRCFIKR